MAGNSSQGDRLWHVAQQLVEESKSIPFVEEEGHGQRIQIKYNQLVSNLSCVGDIIAAMFQKKIVTLKELEQVQHLQSTPIRANEVLLSIIARKPRDAFQSFLSIIKDTNQLHLYQMLVSDDDTCEEATSEDSTDHQDSIRRNFMELSEKLDTENGLISLLYQKNVLTVREREDFFCTKNTFQKNELLLGLLCKKSPKDFEAFLKALQASGQSYLAMKLRKAGVSPADPTTVPSADSAPQVTCICHKGLPKKLDKARQKTFPDRSFSKPVIPPKSLPTSGQHLVASRSLSKPLPPEKPRIRQTAAQYKSESNCSFVKPTEITFSFPRTDLVIFQTRLKELELTVQTDIAVKVTSIFTSFWERPTDCCFKLCFHALLQEIDQKRNEIFSRTEEANKELQQLRKISHQCLSAESLIEVYRTQINSFQKELTSERLQSKKELIQLEEKMHKLKSDLKNEQTRCKRIEEEKLTMNTIISEIEAKLKNTECLKQSYKQEINKLNDRLLSIEYELEKSEEKFREAKVQVNLVKAESEQWRNALEILRKENEIRTDVETQLLQTQTVNQDLLRQLQEKEILLEEKIELNLTEGNTLATNERRAVEYDYLRKRISELQEELENQRHQRQELDDKLRYAEFQLEQKNMTLESTDNAVIMETKKRLNKPEFEKVKYQKPSFETDRCLENDLTSENESTCSLKFDDAQTPASSKRQSDTSEERSHEHYRILHLQEMLHGEIHRSQVLEEKLHSEIAQLEKLNRHLQSRGLTLDTPESRVIMNNHQFLVENMVSSFSLIDSMYKENCITDEERYHLKRQPNNLFRNHSLLHWMTTIHLIVIKCKILSRLEKERKLVGNLFPKSSSKKWCSLQEKEAIVIRKLNDTNRPRWNGFYSRTTKPEEEYLWITIAPYCLQEAEGIVIWFWCMSEDELSNLQTSYSSGSLLENLITVFKEFSCDGSSSASKLLVPTNITIFMDDFAKNENEFISLNWTQKNPDIRGLTVLNKEVFVLCYKRHDIEAYDSTKFHFKRQMTVDGMTYPENIVSCSIKNCLYTSDSKYQKLFPAILRIDPINGNLIKVWKIHALCGILSVASDTNVILCPSDEFYLHEFTADGELIRRIDLGRVPDDRKTGNIEATHAVKLASGLFVVCQSCPGRHAIYLLSTKETSSTLERIDEIEIKKKFSKESGDLNDSLSWPGYLSYDKGGSILVSGAFDNGAVLVSPNFDKARNLVSAGDRMSSLRSTCFDESTGRWLVTDGRYIMVCRVENEKVERAIYSLSSHEIIRIS